VRTRDDLAGRVVREPDAYVVRRRSVQVVADRLQARDLIERVQGVRSRRVAVDLLAATEVVVEVRDERDRGTVLRDEQQVVGGLVGVLEVLVVRVGDPGAVAVRILGHVFDSPPIKPAQY
jgi:hypothetical protein